jgi:hypothetical protein
MLSKLKKIFLSRLKETIDEEWKTKRRETCLGCKHNTLNGGSLKNYRFILATLSLLYSQITGNKSKDRLGECNLCGCSIFYKSDEKDEDCKHRPSKWEKLDDGTMRLNVREQKVF